MRKFFGTRYLSKFTEWREFCNFEDREFNGHDLQTLWLTIRNALPDADHISEDVIPFWNVMSDTTKDEVWTEWIQQVQRIMRAGKLPPFHKHAGHYDGKEVDMNINLDGRLLTSKGTLLRNKLGLQGGPVTIDPLQPLNLAPLPLESSEPPNEEQALVAQGSLEADLAALMEEDAASISPSAAPTEIVMQPRLSQAHLRRQAIIKTLFVQRTDQRLEVFVRHLRTAQQLKRRLLA
jgi:hypothetical protein